MLSAADFKFPPVSARSQAIATRFFAAAQNDFAARLKWSTTPDFNKANHPPVVTVNGPRMISPQPGSIVHLQGTVSDPDHNATMVRWWQYNDAGTYPGQISISDPSVLSTNFRVPVNAKSGQTINVVLEVTDEGTPPLTRYRRVVITVR